MLMGYHRSTGVHRVDGARAPLRGGGDARDADLRAAVHRRDRTRQSRTITSTRLSFSAAQATIGQSVPLAVGVTPSPSGPVTVQMERFDPVFGWQFFRTANATVSGDAADSPFIPPAVGRWRAKAVYGGSRLASPSATGFTYLSVR